ncbi:uncharacterized protein LOC133730478 [Rosa rugosa]|uniref:uncharacterized protein LOC133730478 n=1 Tax=Rosa rugosa TaxID=74645 RepID=UPI002B40A100|nr:uncharacterized protein LOC133730478 [Rosa rugosa]
MLNVSIVEFHEKYLGLPTTIGRNKKEVFRKMNERLDSHLQDWQGKFLSKARKGGGVRGIHWCNWERLCRRKEDGGLGFRDLRAVNQSMLAKTVWRIFWGRSSLVSELLQAKYFPNSCFLDATVGTSPSAVWRGLIWGKQVINRGTRWRIGDGKRVSIKSDRWLPCPTSFRVVSPINVPVDWKVERLFTESGAWNVPMVRSLFLSHETEMILGLPMGLRTTPDKLVWH